MACTALTKGRGVDCNRISGGIKNIYFGVLDDFTAPIETAGIVVSAGEVTDIEMGGNDLYRYTMPMGVASATETVVGSRDNGTIYYTPTVEVIFNRLTKEDQNQIKLLGQTKVVVFAELNQQVLASGNNVIIALGVVNGMEMNAGTITTGASWGDRNGYNLTFDGMEQEPFPVVADYTSTPFDNAAFTINSIVTS